MAERVGVRETECVGRPPIIESKPYGISTKQVCTRATANEEHVGPWSIPPAGPLDAPEGQAAAIFFNPLLCGAIGRSRAVPGFACSGLSFGPRIPMPPPRRR